MANSTLQKSTGGTRMMDMCKSMSLIQGQKTNDILMEENKRQYIYHTFVKYPDIIQHHLLGSQNIFTYIEYTHYLGPNLTGISNSEHISSKS